MQVICLSIESNWWAFITFQDYRQTISCLQQNTATPVLMQFSNIKSRMTNGQGVGSLIYGNGPTNNSHHYIDSLQRFQKDFATLEKQRREQESRRKFSEIERHRQRNITREQRRYKVMDQQYYQEQEMRDRAINEERMRVRKRANVTSLPYNPISLEYEHSGPGAQLKRQDEDHQIRNLVRAHNIDNKGNGKYNPLTGESRVGIEKLVPNDLGDRFSSRLGEHYEGYKIQLPESSYSRRSLSHM